MKKLAVILFLLFKVGLVFGAESVAGTSAKLSVPVGVPPMNRISYQSTVYETAKQKKAVERVLDLYRSPMKQSLDTFFETCKANNLDCYLLPAIAGLESGFGNYVLPDSYNPFGWGGGKIRFTNWDQAIWTVGNGLRTNYIGRGAQSIEQIGSLYAESPTWASRVRRYMTEFQAQEDSGALGAANLTPQL